MGLAGKKVRVFFEDNGQVKPRVAVVVEESVAFLTIKNDFGVEAIPTCKIIRVEVLSNGN
jgi:hypothetical protein